MTRTFPLRPAPPQARPWKMTIRMPPSGGGGCCCSIGPLVWRETGTNIASSAGGTRLLHVDIVAEGCGGSPVFKPMFADAASIDELDYAAEYDDVPRVSTLNLSGPVLTYDASSVSAWGSYWVSICVVMTCAGREIYSNPLHDIYRAPA